MKKSFTILCAIGGLLLPGCASDQVVPGDTAAQVRNFINTIEPGLKPAAASACSLVLSFAVDPKDRAEVKSDLFVVASIVSAVTPDQTPGDLSRAIQAALPKADEYKTLADSIAGGFAIALPFIKGDSQLFLKVTSDLAAGCVQVAGAP